MARKSFLRDFTPRCSGSTASFSRDLEHPACGEHARGLAQSTRVPPCPREYWMWVKVSENHPCGPRGNGWKIVSTPSSWVTSCLSVFKAPLVRTTNSSSPGNARRKCAHEASPTGPL